VQESPAARDSRARIVIAIVTAVALTAIIVVVAAASGGGSDAESATVAAPRCIDAWNSDPNAYGRHNFSFHLYKGALVTFLTPTGAEVGAGEGGVCAVIFPSQALDPEPFAAGEVLDGGSWIPISSLKGVELSRLAELQVLAAGSPNTTLDVRGELAAL
jgi:hypothetical protein